MWQAISEGFLAGFIVSIAVGPIFFVLLDISINLGWKHGISYILGVFTSDIIIVNALINWGVFDLIQNSMHIQATFYKIGGGLLFFFGLYKAYSAFKSEPKVIQVANVNIGSHINAYIKGFTINTFTPTVLLFWVGMAALFATREYATLPNAAIAFFGSIVATVIFLDVCKNILASKLRSILNANLIRKINIFLGLIILLIGLQLSFKGWFF